MEPILNEGNFNQTIDSASEPVLVEFFATWCPHCKRMQPILDDVASRADGKYDVYQVDVDQSPDLADKYAPNGFPTYVLFENGIPSRELVGEQTEESLLALVA